MIEFADQERPNFVAYRRRYLEANRRPKRRVAARSRRRRAIVGLALFHGVRSALRVTRKDGARRSSCPGTVARVGGDHLLDGHEEIFDRGPQEPGNAGGTLTRANKRRPSYGSAGTTARLSDRSEMYGNGWPGSTANGVSVGKMPGLKMSGEVELIGRVEIWPIDDDDAAAFEPRINRRARAWARAV